MDHLRTINFIRQLVDQLVVERRWGVVDEIVETILISKGFYSGRCYRYEQGHACWIAAAQQIQLYDLDNQLIETIDVTDEDLQDGDNQDVA